MTEDDDDGQNALKPERFSWVAHFVGAMLVAFAFMALTIAAHLVGAVEDHKMTEAQSRKL